MNDLVRVARKTVPKSCHARRCSRDGCSVSLAGIDEERVIVDMDCEELPIPDIRKRCDYLFIGKGNWIAPIEMK